MFFIGAGQRNAVFGLLPSFFALAGNGDDETPTMRSSAELQQGDGLTDMAGRVSRDLNHSECLTCVEALQKYCGVHHLRRLHPLQRDLLLAHLEAADPSHISFKQLLCDALRNAETGVAMMMMPNFSVNSLHFLRDLSTALCSLSRHPLTAPLPSPTADMVIEVKPKSVWRPPEIVGIQIGDAEPIFIHPGKRSRCRFSQMQCLKRTGADMEREPPYCPNYLYRKDLSTLEGLQRLLRRPSNNLVVIAGESTCSPLHCSAVAQALDASDLLPTLESLQLRGVARNTEEKSHLPDHVLDIELLYPWTCASSDEAVFWIVEETNADLHCECVRNAPCSAMRQQEEGVRVRVAPWLSRDECVRRFYAATTARDVSIIVSLSSVSCPVEDVDLCTACFLPGTAGSFTLTAVSGACYLCRVGVVDLDDKRRKSLKWYHERDAQCLRAAFGGL